MDNLLLPPEPFLTGKPLGFWLDNMGIRDWSINAEGLVDVAGTLRLTSKLGTLKRLPVRFGNVGRDFYCSYNKLESLEGAPKHVSGDFFCHNNQLVSLEGAPKEVGMDFACSQNQLVSLEGAPKKVGRNFSCSQNQLVSLEGAPEQIGGYFACNVNQLVSLEGAPKYVGWNFWCDHNLLVDFKGLEVVSIGGELMATNCEIIGRDNVFVSLEGLPKNLYGKLKGLDIPTLLAVESQHYCIPDIEI